MRDDIRTTRLKGFDYCLMGGCAREHRLAANACLKCGHNREVNKLRLARIKTEGLTVVGKDAWSGKDLWGIRV
jgi:hypothetical protein